MVVGNIQEQTHINATHARSWILLYWNNPTSSQKNALHKKPGHPMDGCGLTHIKGGSNAYVDNGRRNKRTNAPHTIRTSHHTA